MKSKVPLTVGSYDLLDKLGRGGMGTVYRGRHRVSGQTVAIKVLTAAAALDRVLRKRFEQEFLAASRLRHPHIVQGLEVSLAHDPPYLVMEFVDGPSVGQLVRTQGKLAEAQALPIIIQVAQALHTAHQARLIHRDIKPDNIMLSPDGNAKLTDLGLVKDLEGNAELTRSRTCLGTAFFMAPEQFDDARRVDVATDIYGLAATLYWSLTGVLPFPGKGHLTLLKKKLANEFLPPSEHVASLSPRVNEAICRALNSDPKQRPASCADFVAALTGHGLEQTVTVTPLPMAKASGKERRRAARFSSSLDTVCRPVSQSGCYAAEVLDMSTTGLRLVVERQFQPGTLLVVEGKDETQEVPRIWLIRVVWARPQGNQWGLGGAFIHALSAGELKALIDREVPTVVIEQYPDF